MNIVLSSDDNYSTFLATAMASILSNATPEDELNFFILDDGLSSENRRKIEALKKIRPCIIKFHPIAEDLPYSFVLRRTHVTRAAYHRFFIADYFPHLSKALYLDIDIVVIDSLRDLYNTELGNYTFAAAAQKNRAKHNTRLGLPEDNPHFNSGVLLLNLDVWRHQGITEKLMQTMLEYKETIDADQDIMNIFFKSNYLQIPARWNSHAGHLKSLGQASVVHFIGNNKFKEPFSGLLYKYVRKTEFRRFKQQDIFWFINAFRLWLQRQRRRFKKTLSF